MYFTIWKLVQVRCINKAPRDNLEGWGGKGVGSRGSGWRDTRIPMADSCRRMGEKNHDIVK